MPRKIYNIPNGPLNLMPLFPGLPWSNIAEYYVKIFSGGDPIATATSMLIDGCKDDIRIHFQNYVGTVDSLTGHLKEILHETTSKEYENPVSYPLVKSLHALSKLSVRSNDIHTLVIEVEEEKIRYYDELLDSTLAWIEWEGEQAQASDYIPILLIDGKSIKRQAEDRFYYEVTVSFKFSHETITIGN